MTTSTHGGAATAAECSEPGCREAAVRGDEWIGEYCSVDSDGRAYFHHLTKLHDSVRADNEQEFRDLAKTYHADPGNFPVAWQYLTKHPIFHRPLARGGETRTYGELDDEERRAIDAGEIIEDCDGLAHLRLRVNVDRGGTSIHLEHGPHVWGCDVPKEEHWQWPVSGQPTHDCRLDASAPTYEEAIVLLAFNVAACYGDSRQLVSRIAEP